MGIFSSLFGNGIKNENKSRPFYQNQNDEERLDWFKRTKPWNEIDPKIINAVIKKFNGDPMLEVFVITSMKHNLTPYFCKLSNLEGLDSPHIICTYISQIFYNLGSNSLKQMLLLMDNTIKNREQCVYHNSIIMDSLETAIILDNKLLPAYLSLAVAKKSLNQFEESLKFAMRGLDAIKEIRKDNIPFHLSNLDSIKNANQNIDEMEKELEQIVKECR